MGARLMAIVAEGDRGRVYLGAKRRAMKRFRCRRTLSGNLKPQCPNREMVFTAAYGMPNFADLFTDRQLVALTTFSDLVGEARERIRLDAVAAELPDDRVPLREGGTGATAYAEAVECISDSRSAE